MPTTMVTPAPSRNIHMTSPPHQVRKARTANPITAPTIKPSPNVIIPAPCIASSSCEHAYPLVDRRCRCWCACLMPYAAELPTSSAPPAALSMTSHDRLQKKVHSRSYYHNYKQEHCQHDRAN